MNRFTPSRETSRHLSRFILAALGAAILVLHTSLFVLDASPSPRVLVGDETMYFEKAQTIGAGVELHHDPMWPPLYPLVVAGLLTIDRDSLTVVWLFQSALLVGIALLVAALARAWLGNGPHVVVAAVLVLLNPTLAAYAHYLWPELLHASLLILAVWILATRRHRPAWVAAYGAALGLALLTKSLLTPVIPLSLVPLVWGIARREALTRATIAILAMGAVCTPTLVASYRETGHAFIADSSIFNLWVGLTDTSRRARMDRSVAVELRAFESRGRSHSERNQATREKILALIAERGPVRILRDQLSRQYFRLFTYHTDLSDQLPGGVFALHGGGYAGESRALTRCIRAWSIAFHALLLVAFAFALTTVPFPREPWWWAVVAFLTYNVALFLFVHVKARYRIQLEPFLVLWTACGIGVWLRHGRMAGATRPILGALLALVLLFFAFGGDWLDT